MPRSALQLAPQARLGATVLAVSLGTALALGGFAPPAAPPGGGQRSALDAFDGLDSVSEQCFACHADSVGELDPEGFVLAGSRIASHPVGVRYQAGTARHGMALRPAAGLSPTLRLPSGRVTCVTCHAVGEAPALGEVIGNGACAVPSRLTLPRRSLCTGCHLL